MCGRFTLTYQDTDRLAAELGVPLDSFPDYRARYNIAPEQQHWVVRMHGGHREVLAARWGLINNWATKGHQPTRHINARGETVDRLPAFRAAFKRRRCIIPADGFFEWAGARRSRMPIWYHRPDGGLLPLAGLYESWEISPDEWELTFTIITTRANEAIEPVHDRMPVILPTNVLDEWLQPALEDGETLKELLTTAPQDLLVATPVSPRVNSVRYDDPACLEEYDSWRQRVGGGSARH